MKTAVIFGVTGQVGSYLAEELLGHGRRVLGVKRRTSGPNLGRLGNVLQNPHFRLIEGDVCDPYGLRPLFEGADEVYNLAAMSHVHTSFQQPHLTWAVTAEGVLNLLETLRLFPRVRFFQASSSEMFGTSRTTKYRDIAAEMDGLRTDAEKGAEGRMWHCQDEHTPFLPQSPYAIAKLAAHHACRLYREAYQLQISCGILFNMEGPRRGENFVTRKITKYVAELSFGLEKGKLKLGNIDAKRDWVHVKDSVRAMRLMVDKPGDYVIATGETHSVQEFLEESFHCAGFPDWGPHVEIDQGLFRPSEVPYLRGDFGKAQRELGWNPTISFKELVADMVKSDLEEAHNR